MIVDLETLSFIKIAEILYSHWKIRKLMLLQDYNWDDMSQNKYLNQNNLLRCCPDMIYFYGVLFELSIAHHGFGLLMTNKVLQIKLWQILLSLTKNHDKFCKNKRKLAYNLYDIINLKNNCNLKEINILAVIVKVGPLTKKEIDPNYKIETLYLTVMDKTKKFLDVKLRGEILKRFLFKKAQIFYFYSFKYYEKDNYIYNFLNSEIFSTPNYFVPIEKFVELYNLIKTKEVNEILNED